MALEIWLPGLFLLGLVSMGACFLFMSACENIKYGPNYDLCNRGSFTLSLHLFVCSFDSARMVLTRPAAELRLGVSNNVAFTNLDSRRHDPARNPAEQISLLDYGREIPSLGTFPMD